jgi:HEAT repeat protein
MDAPSAPALPAQVARTVLSLIQALLKTGYYEPGHPQTEKARMGLFEEITALFDNHPEITFMANVRDERPEVLVGGVSNDFLAMRRVMPRNMADMFLPKLVDFFRRKRLSSFSLRHDITRQEFDDFTDILTSSGWMEDIKVDVRDRMCRMLVDKQIFNVSVVFIDDLVGTQGRKLPWRVEATLSRLKRDLNMLPLYKHVDQKAIRGVRQQVFEEIIHPLKDPNLVRDLLINVDLIIETLHDFDRDSFIYTLIEHLDPAILPAVCQLVVIELAELQRQQIIRDRDEELATRAADVNWVARRLAEKLLEDERADAVLFHALVRHKVYLYDEIPPQLREEISELQAVDTLLENRQKFFAEIEESPTPEMLAKRLWRLLEMFPELVRQKHDAIAREVISFAQRYGDGFSLRHREQIVERLRKAAALRAMDEGKEGVDELLKTLATLDRTGLEILVDLADHENRAVRRLGLEALAQRGQAAVPVLFEAVVNKKGWHFLRNMLLLLVRINAGGPKVEKLFRRCLVHPEPHVRCEAVVGLAKLTGPAAEKDIVGKLEDKDAEVRKKAVGALAEIGIHQESTVKQLAGQLADTKGGGEAMALQVVSTLNKLRPPPFDTPELEDALLELVKPKGFLGMGKGKETALTGPLREGGVQALGYVGTEKCKKVLEKLLKDDSSAVVKGAREALARISDR